MGYDKGKKEIENVWADRLSLLFPGNAGKKSPRSRLQKGKREKKAPLTRIASIQFLLQTLKKTARKETVQKGEKKTRRRAATSVHSLISSSRKAREGKDGKRSTTWKIKEKKKKKKGFEIRRLLL